MPWPLRVLGRYVSSLQVRTTGGCLLGTSAVERAEGQTGRRRVAYSYSLCRGEGVSSLLVIGSWADRRGVCRSCGTRSAGFLP
eukprot:COSAG02_NODE_42120_length_387_cov_1.444444_1_plen_82_part_10